MTTFTNCKNQTDRFNASLVSYLINASFDSNPAVCLCQKTPNRLKIYKELPACEAWTPPAWWLDSVIDVMSLNQGVTNSLMDCFFSFIALERGRLDSVLQ